jgi:hypothetical protein
VSGNDGVEGFLAPVQPDKGVPTQVDITSLEGAAPWLEGLKQYVQDHLITATGTMHLTKNYGDLYFGGVDSAPLVYNKHNNYVKAVIESYRDVARALGVAAEATKSIAQNYRDAEHNNALDVAAVEKAFSGESTGTTTTGSTGDPSTQGSF